MGAVLTLISMLHSQLFHIDMPDIMHDHDNNQDLDQDLDQELLSSSMLDPDKYNKIEKKLDYSREEYLKVVDNTSLSLEHISKYSNDLIKCIENISGISGISRISNTRYDDTQILINKRKYILHDSLIIGRSELLLDYKNGIYIPEYFKPYKISRLHVVLLLISDMIFVIDTGSYNGVRTIYRSDTSKNLEHSTKDKRQNLTFHISERVDLVIGKYELVIFGGGMKKYDFSRKRKHQDI